MINKLLSEQIKFIDEVSLGIGKAMVVSLLAWSTNSPKPDPIHKNFNLYLRTNFIFVNPFFMLYFAIES